jgi:hypothetical protein
MTTKPGKGCFAGVNIVLAYFRTAAFGESRSAMIGGGDRFSGNFLGIGFWIENDGKRYFAKLPIYFGQREAAVM